MENASSGKNKLEAHAQRSPLLSSSLIRRAVIIAVIIICFVAALNIGVKWYGERILQAGHTTATDAVEITIGNDRLKLAKNTLRVPSDRHDGERERADLYLTGRISKGYEDSIALFSMIRRRQQGLFSSSYRKARCLRTCPAVSGRSMPG